MHKLTMKTINPIINTRKKIKCPSLKSFRFILNITLLCIGIFNYSIESVPASIFVGVKLGDTVYIGADSKQGDTTSCKIIIANNVCFSVTGEIRFIFPHNTFNLQDTVYSIVTQKKTVGEKFDELEEKLNKTFENIAKTISIYEPTAPYLTEQHSFDIIWAGITDGTAYFAVGFYEFIFQKTEVIFTDIRLSVCPGYCQGNTVWYISTEIDSIKRFQERYPNFWAIHPIDAINIWIKFATQEEPELIGEPIDILKITPDGPCWIQCKDGCKDRIPNCDQ